MKYRFSLAIFAAFAVAPLALIACSRTVRFAEAPEATAADLRTERDAGAGDAGQRDAGPADAGAGDADAGTGQLPSPGQVVLIGLSWSFFNHAASGIRHFLLDIGAGFELAANNRWSVLTPLLAIALTAAFWAAIYLR